MAQHRVVEPPVQPRLTIRVITMRFDRFLEDVGVVAADTSHFLSYAFVQPSHQVVAALVPRRVALRQISFYMSAVRLHDLFADRLSIKRRQLTTPIDDLLFVGTRAHANSTINSRATNAVTTVSSIPHTPDA